MHKKLFIPGPIEVSKDTLQALTAPMIGHRGKEYEELHGRVKPKLKKVFHTECDVFISTSSATGVMEGAVRNLVNKRVLSCVCGAFSDRWFEIAKVNGKEADPLNVDWGKAIKPDMIEDKLKTGNYDAITLVHNETSTGVMHNLEEISAVMRKFPDVLFIVDAVSSLAGVKIEVDKLGIDVCIVGVQKAFGLPPGLALFSVSQKAFDKAKSAQNRGYYFDIIEFKEYDKKNQTPCTPAISLIFGLDYQLDKMFKEGLDNRYARHIDMANLCRKWAVERFNLFPEKGYESITLTTVNNVKNIDLSRLNSELGKRGMVISDGYGKLKGKTFRIAHMGDCTKEELVELLNNIDDILKL